MGKTLAIFGLAALLIAPAWLRLEQGPWEEGDPLLVVALALVPTIAVALGRRRLVVGLAAAVSGVVAAGVAFGVPLTDARPGDRDTDFLDPVLASFRQGFLEFFDTRIPFNGLDFPSMHGVVLLAVFAFVTLVGIAVAARRPLAAAAVLVIAVAWPVTISSSWGSEVRPLATGAILLASVFAILFLLRDGGRPARGVANAAVLGAVLLVVSVAASTSEAVAKGAFVRWEDWDLHDPPQPPVGVSYVWNSNYNGISFPQKKTVVLKVRVPGPRRALYWRATTLDEYTGTNWREILKHLPNSLVDAEQIDMEDYDPLLPKAAEDEDKWVRQDVKVEALRDSHLIGSAQPVRWRPGTSFPVQLATNGTAAIPQQLRRGQEYTVWSYVPRANPSELGDASTDYPAELDPYLRLDALELPPFTAPDREAHVRELLASDGYVGVPHSRVFEVARTLTRDAKSPYDAAVALEAWFRSDGGFEYDENPPPYGSTPPLVQFILEDKRGYCQQFAGGMAMMLRLLGIPARVAAGFTSGTYDEDKREWTVTDHNAHTWVEVYFPAFGWIPFDPTPNRGRLSAAYTPFSDLFNARDAIPYLSGGAAVSQSAVRAQLDRSEREDEGFRPDVAGGATAPEEGRGGSLVALALLLLAAGTVALLVVKAVRRALRFATRDPRATAAACRRDLVGFLADQGLDPPASATLAELGAFVESQFAAPSAPFVHAANAARFGPPNETRRAMRRARRELKALRSRIRAELTVPQRARGALSLRSLGV